eukprot:PhM_4_TR9957/c0_g2_i1/m.9421
MSVPLFLCVSAIFLVVLSGGFGGFMDSVTFISTAAASRCPFAALHGKKRDAVAAPVERESDISSSSSSDSAALLVLNPVNFHQYVYPREATLVLFHDKQSPASVEALTTLRQLQFRLDGVDKSTQLTMGVVDVREHEALAQKYVGGPTRTSAAVVVFHRHVVSTTLPVINANEKTLWVMIVHELEDLAYGSRTVHDVEQLVEEVHPMLLKKTSASSSSSSSVLVVFGAFYNNKNNSAAVDVFRNVSKLYRRALSRSRAPYAVTFYHATAADVVAKHAQQFERTLLTKDKKNADGEVSSFITVVGVSPYVQLFAEINDLSDDDTIRSTRFPALSNGDEDAELYERDLRAFLARTILRYEEGAVRLDDDGREDFITSDLQTTAGMWFMPKNLEVEAKRAFATIEKGGAAATFVPSPSMQFYARRLRKLARQHDIAWSLYIVSDRTKPVLDRLGFDVHTDVDQRRAVGLYVPPPNGAGPGFALARWRFPDNKFSIDGVDRFVKAVGEGKVAEYVRTQKESEVRPHDHDGSLVLVGSTFPKAVAEHARVDSPLVVFLHYPWKSECHSFLPQFKEYAKKRGGGITFATLDLSKNDLPSVYSMEQSARVVMLTADPLSAEGAARAKAGDASVMRILKRGGPWSVEELDKWIEDAVRADKKRMNKNKKKKDKNNNNGKKGTKEEL